MLVNRVMIARLCAQSTYESQGISETIEQRTLGYSIANVWGEIRDAPPFLKQHNQRALVKLFVEVLQTNSTAWKEKERSATADSVLSLVGDGLFHHSADL